MLNLKNDIFFWYLIKLVFLFGFGLWQSLNVGVQKPMLYQVLHG